MTTETKTATSFRETIFLPRTDFPMKANLPDREPVILKRWQEIDLWDRTRRVMEGRPEFVLHDGPIYSNGNIHIGHALNRILKDVVMRAHRMGGEKVDFVPGWDTHGLPIEWKVEEEYRSAGKDKDAVNILDFRAECRRYSQHWMDVQAAEFIRLGVQGDWTNRYATMDFPSEAAIAAEIGKFLMNGSLYRGLRPVMWSPVEKTALAEAEIEYHERTSDTVYVRVPILSRGWEDVSAVYWTTTPWTVPGTRGISLGARIDYSLLRIGTVSEDAKIGPGSRLLVAATRLEDFCAATGIKSFEVERRLEGSQLAGLQGRHPLHGCPNEGDLYSGPIPFITADYITDEQGTGFVPCAPAHGEEDFEVGNANGLQALNTVAPDGRLYDWTGPLGGVHVFKSGEQVAAVLQERGMLVGTGTIRHSYPHSWRSKAPVIYRATPQWFIRLDGPEEIRRKALDAISMTVFVPPSGANRLGSMVADRPDWCVSRQRVWGVPIPVFVDRKTGAPLRDQAVLDRTIAAFEREGADAWYASPPSRFLGEELDADRFEQVRDIVDVWFESGSTHAFVLADRGMKWPADLYLEGTDQHRGWFQSSLLEAIGTRGEAPFKAVLTHGFVVDENGRKMSKSVGNVVSPQEVTDRHGADILRLWVMNSDMSEDLRMGPEILKQQAELYRRLRNTLRWLLGNLSGFSEEEAIALEAMPSLDRWVLHRLSEFDRRFRKALETHDWTGVYAELHTFCSNDLSAFYFDIRKDALYCDHAGSLRRRAARTVLDGLHRYLCMWLAPVLCFTAEEAWLARFPSATGSVHLECLPDMPVQWLDPTLGETWAAIRALRRQVTEQLEAGRAQGHWGSSLGARAELHLPSTLQAALTEEEWAETLIVSSVNLHRATGATTGSASVAPAIGHKCERCWQVRPDVGQGTHPSLCLRCDDVIARTGALDTRPL